MQTITLKLSGLHCTSCAVDIDLTLEDIPGVKDSTTNYAKSESKVTYDPNQTDIKVIKNAIHNLDFQVE